MQLFVDQAALWRLTQVRALDVIEAATQLLVDGVESPSILSIACLVESEAESELGDHLDDLALDRPAFDHRYAEVIASAALCRSYLVQEGNSHELTRRIHRIFSHDCHPLIEALSSLGDMFDTLHHFASPSRGQLVANTRAAAQSLVDEADRILGNAHRQQP
jgi:hypothetical protein